MEQTWKIRDGMPDGSWGPEREVTLAQFKAEQAAKSKIAREIHAANVASLKGAA